MDCHKETILNALNTEIFMQDWENMQRELSLGNGSIMFLLS